MPQLGQLPLAPAQPGKARKEEQCSGQDLCGDQPQRVAAPDVKTLVGQDRAEGSLIERLVGMATRRDRA
jgi:hypothetical protein